MASNFHEQRLLRLVERLTTQRYDSRSARNHGRADAGPRHVASIGDWPHALPFAEEPATGEGGRDQIVMEAFGPRLGWAVLDNVFRLGS